ncbi:PBP1A family penicillin-binding protein [Weizmannia acidiproducens]|uniref:transglycosylase domain-containing protein n=1 Tax=Heyndrickxia acidiproducens TaxID=1121084 RepID=UPI00037306AA
MDKLKPFRELIKKYWKTAHMNQIIILVASVTLLAFLAFFAYYAKSANVGQLKKGLEQTTIIYDKDGDQASKISANRSEGVPITRMPADLQNAIVAIEDHRFYKHRGFDVIGTMSALVKNIRAGGTTAGGSTITQQLTKNALLSPERTLKRKVQELFLAIEIEKHYSKKEILEMYLNQVYFGEGAWGVQKAANKYFGKDVENLDLSESATLAGLVNAPSALDPYNHYKRAIERRNVVLGAMKDNGMITSSQYKAAAAEQLTLKDKKTDSIKGKYPYYTDAVLEEAIKRYGLNQEEILTRGYKIYTEMDQNIQSALEYVYQQNSLFPSGTSDQIVQSGGILVNPATGGVRGLVGGRGEKVFRGFNRATQLKRQPGSIMKPITVYTPALEEGYDPESVLKDKKMTYKGGYSPGNYNHQYLGEVPMYTAVEKSLNAPAVWLLNKIGVEKGYDAAKKFGIPVTKQDKQLGIALGNIQNGVSPEDIAEAYTTFPNGGKKTDVHIIRKIVSPTGKVLAEHKDSETRVTSKKVSQEMTSMLLNVVESGTGKGVSVPGYKIAGKTGSTQLEYRNIDGTMDQWFAGYTPNLVGVVWMGYDETDRSHYLYGLSEQGIVPVFNAVMNATLKYTKAGDFDVDSINQQQNDGGQLKEKLESIDETIKKQTDKLKDTIDENKGTWKSTGEKIKEKLQNILGQ